MIYTFSTNMMQLKSIAIIFVSTYILLVRTDLMCQDESNHDDEERLLERVIRNELALETLLKEIKGTNEDVIKGLREMRNTKTEVGELANKLERSETVTTLKTGKFMKDALSNITSELVRIRSNLDDATTNWQTDVPSAIKRGPPSIQPVYFHARSPAEAKLDADQDVIFTFIELNEGSGYNSSSGIFTASIAGLYMFSVQYCTMYGQNAWLAIVKNGTLIQVARNYGSSGSSPCATMQVISTMAVGDTVWVRTVARTELHENDGVYRSTFFGVLLV
ncbi:uncharacterized protein LOC127850758 [Dreissena polymorpha]|uniref:C1q domain-containing protein n=1 Tax=Dreissena polymorpha TaxID=45954 RepID=A0A9D4CXT3_DREPO|nr:uncharacterized protein LOC127850758 [Dreissena polymorpha]KAH3734001.1 hypothetical protein DPMN_040440 [Dreissena polymorpha]